MYFYCLKDVKGASLGYMNENNEVVSVFCETNVIIFHSTSPSMRVIQAYDDNKAEGLSLYKKLCELGGTLEYVDAMKYLGLQIAYTEEAVEVARESFMELLNE